MTGTNSDTGKAISGFAHFQQSVRDILSTPVGSRVMRRDYGSRLPDLVDAPTNPKTLAQIYYETAIAILRWEPRLQLTRVTCQSVAPGQIVLALTGNYLPDGQTVTLDGIVVS